MNRLNLAIGYQKDKETVEQIIKDIYPEDYDEVLKEISELSETIRSEFEKEGYDINDLFAQYEVEDETEEEETEEEEEEEEEEEDVEEEELEDYYDDSAFSDYIWNAIRLDSDTIDDYLNDIVESTLRVCRGLDVTEEEVIQAVFEEIGIREADVSLDTKPDIKGFIKKTVQKITKAVTGKDLKDLRNVIKKTSDGKVEVNVFGKSYVWVPEEHPRDRLGRFTFKPGSGEKTPPTEKAETDRQKKRRLRKGELKDVSELESLDWKKLPGRKLLKGVAGKVKINGTEYVILKGVNKEDFVRAVEKTEKIKINGKELFGEDFEVANQVIYSTKNARARQRYLKGGIFDVYIQKGEVYKAPLYDPARKTIVYSDADIQGSFLEATLVKENLRHNMLKRKIKDADTQEVVMDILSQYYAEKYDANNFLYNPRKVSWMTNYAKKKGYTSEDLYAEVLEEYKGKNLKKYIKSKKSFLGIGREKTIDEFMPNWKEKSKKHAEECYSKKGVVVNASKVWLAVRIFLSAF